MRPITPDVELAFHCPGEVQPVTRAVHLARLAAFYPPCQNCPQRIDEAGLSAGRRAHRRALELVDQKDCELDAAPLVLHDRSFAEFRDLGGSLGLQHWIAAEPHGPILVGGDGRSVAAEPLAAITEGLRLVGLDVVDVGATTAPCLLDAASRYGARGAVLLAGVERFVRGLALHAWQADGTRIRLAACDPQTPGKGWAAFRRSRKSGSIGRRRIDVAYLEQFSHLFHGLRPLRLVVETRCEPALKFLRQLLRSTGCELIGARVVPSVPADIPRRVAGGTSAAESFQGHVQIENLARQVRTDRADFGCWIDSIGQLCTVVDDRGECVGSDRLARLLGRDLSTPPAGDGLHCLATLLVEMSRCDRPLSAIVDEQRRAE